MLSKTSNKVIARYRDFKHEVYHNVNCISKEVGYRNNRGTRRRGCIPEFLLFRGVSLVGEVWTNTMVQQPQRFHLLLRWTAPQRFGSPSTIGIFRGGNPEPFNNDPGHNPQRDWGLPNSYKWPPRVSTTTRASRVQGPKSNKFPSFQLPRILVESTNRCTKQW